MDKKSNNKKNDVLNEKEIENEGVNDMANMTLTVDNFSLSDFIKANKAKIDSITPHNPTIKKDDEWRNEDFWDDLYKEKFGK